MSAIISLLIALLPMVIQWLLTIISGGTLTPDQQAKIGKLRTECRLYIEQCTRLGVNEVSGTVPHQW